MTLNPAALTSLRARILDAVEEEAKGILTLSNERVPVDSGALKASGRVVTDGATTYITYGSNADQNPKTGQPTNAYVERIHEDMEMRHPHGGSAKFLESAANESVAGFAERVAARVR